MSPLPPKRILFAALVVASTAAWTLFMQHHQQQPQPQQQEPFASSLLAQDYGRGSLTSSLRASRRAAVRETAPAACPNLLVRSDNVLLLFRDNVLVSRFASLADYQNYHAREKRKLDELDAEAAKVDGDGDDDAHNAEAKRRRRRRCPVLFLEPETDARGKRSYRHRDPLQPHTDRHSVRTLSASFWDTLPKTQQQQQQPQQAQEGLEQEEEQGQEQGQEEEARSVPSFFAGAMRKNRVAASEQQQQEEAISANPNAVNWGGVRWSQRVIDEKGAGRV